MKLSEKDRLIIANQLLILEKLYPEEADYYAQHRKAVENGFSLHYDDLVSGFAEEMSEDECSEVLDILDMYRVITFSFQRLTDCDIDAAEARFPGFDGNNEGPQYAYANYFIVDLGRYDELRYGAEVPYLNSHRPTLHKYRRMIAAWEEAGRPYELDCAQMRSLLDA